jgi:hypothetical protein
MAYVAQSRGSHFVVENGVERPQRYDGVVGNLFQYSPDSRVLIFGAGDERGQFLMVGDAKSDYYDGFCGPLFFPTSDKLTGLAKRGNSYHVVCEY